MKVHMQIGASLRLSMEFQGRRVALDLRTQKQPPENRISVPVITDDKDVHDVPI